jgi:hypothetical protein
VDEGFHMFGPMKDAMRGRFSSNEKVIGMVQNWLKTKPRYFFPDGIKKLVEHWNQCIEVEGDYIEK